MTLKYNRKGFLPGIPARDLTDEEVEKYGGEEFLISRGIYERPKTGGVIVNQYFAGAKINVTQEDIDELETKREQQAPATPIERPKRETKKANPDRLAKEG